MAEVIGNSFFDHQDYRDLLAELIQQRKDRGQVFSYRWFSNKAGLASPNFLNLVVKKKRHLSTETVEKVIAIFSLKVKEAEFFRLLVNFNKAQTLTEKEFFARQLVKNKDFLREHPLSKDQFDYYSKWYNIPVREFLMIHGAGQKPEEIGENLVPPLPKSEIDDAIQRLKKLRMLIDSDSRWKVTQESVTTGHRFCSFGVIQFHKKMMELAAKSLDRFSAEEREISSVTISLSQQNFHRVKKLIEEFRSQIMALAEEDKAKSQVFQLNFQLFPLSKNMAEPKKSEK